MLFKFGVLGKPCVQGWVYKAYAIEGPREADYSNYETKPHIRHVVVNTPILQTSRRKCSKLPCRLL